MEEKLTLEDFVKAKKALEEARIPEPWVLTSSGIKNLEQMMKEMAGDPKEYGKREPGETCMYERKQT